VLELLFFAEDVRAKNEIEEAVETVEVKKAELQLAEQVIASLVGEWKIEDFENEYRRDLKAMLDAKLAGEKIARPEPVAETPVIDLMEALRRSVAEAGEKKTAARPRKPKAGAPSSSDGAAGSRKKAASARSK
jgi:DNA end-binding protein Ku